MHAEYNVCHRTRNTGNINLDSQMWDNIYCLHYEQVKIFLLDIVQFYSVQINLNVHLELVVKPKGLN